MSYFSNVFFKHSIISKQRENVACILYIFTSDRRCEENYFLKTIGYNFIETQAGLYLFMFLLGLPSDITCFHYSSRCVVTQEN
jgi:hypothetical protein